MFWRSGIFQPFQMEHHGNHFNGFIIRFIRFRTSILCRVPASKLGMIRSPITNIVTGFNVDSRLRIV